MGSDLEDVVDIRGGIAYLLVKWKWIVLAALVAALAGAGFAYVKGAKSPTETVVSHEEKVEKRRAALSETDAVYVEQLVTQYKLSGEQLSTWGRYAVQSALQRMDPYNYVRRDIQYVVSSNNGSAINAFTSALLGQEEFEEIGKILGEDPMTASLQELVFVTNAVQIASGGNPDSAASSTEIINAAGSMHSWIMVATILADTEEEIDSIENVLSDAITKESAALRNSGISINVDEIGVVENRNDARGLLAMQQSGIQPMIQMQSNRSNFVKNSVDTLSENMRSYFDVLCEEETETAETAKPAVKKVSLKKYAAAGALAGLFLAVAVLYLTFVFSDKIRTEEEIRDNYNIPVLQKFCVAPLGRGLAKADPIRNKGLSMLGADRAASVEKGAELLKAELLRKIPREQESRIYIAFDSGSEKVRGAADSLAKALSGEKRIVEAGNPLKEDDAYRKLLGADAVIAAETLGESEKKNLKEILQICGRNGIDVLGSIALIDPRRI
ncbi:MAG TPA: hypothetical protein DCF49_07760 [Lachnospiraceae bacterium]|nr:hypothetical protein [Lachnospiraceae bacterium]